MTDSYIWEHMVERFEEVIREYDESIEEQTGESHSSIIIKPNETDTRDKDDLWFEIFPLHSQPYQQELGTSGRNRWLFGLQININAPRTAIIGTNDIDKAYDFIASHFKRGDIFDGIRVLQMPRRSSARIDDDTYSVPVTVMVQADLDN